eukprot:4935615-Prymnesium_polylepis.1
MQRRRPPHGPMRSVEFRARARRLPSHRRRSSVGEGHATTHAHRTPDLWPMADVVAKGGIGRLR